ncbi:uncharacterized protein KQ657_002547 [Scheffersomyces spartinae]|uniref:PIH1 N-terminal domain-containing protein n=1 Tax=Scheffersomyces spartinae TaxID=45513 RepID=A0A9P7V692_9ASCO|nr:uncharacterized protein KQ657_002547 [Scheffersomyces spartinae]KAG7191941.1 hypothetical protein KQ657_002547 [Scheffersomyces spartinae]
MLRQASGPETTLDPKPGFVVKTKVLGSRTLTSGTKAFINVCHDPQVPLPSVEFDPAVVFPLIMENQWEIPLVVSAEKQSVDKKGVPAVVYDCCMNLQSFQWAQVNKDLRLILIEWCIEAVELLYDMELERAYTTPKMLNKGELSKTIIASEDMDSGDLKSQLEELQRNETLGLIEEIKFNSDDADCDLPLPDLRNINNDPQKRPLIEEISTPRTMKKEEHKATKPIATATSVRQKYDFSVTFLKIESPSSGETLEVAVLCPQLTSDAVLVSYNPASRSIVIHNRSGDFYFVNTEDKLKDILEIPLPPISRTPTNIRSVFEGHPSRLRIFL